MSEFPLGYDKIAPATWAYLSSLLMIGLYFKFNRFWSVRNLDLVLLILLAPGLLMIRHANELESSVKGQIRYEMASVDGGETISEKGTDDLSAPDSKDDSSSAQPAKGGETPPSEQDGEEASSESAAADDDVADDSEDESEAVAFSAQEEAWRSQLEHAERLERAGFVFLFGVGLLLLMRMLADSVMVRRPLLEPNLTSPGLTFIGASLLIFLMSNVITSTTLEEDLLGPQAARELVRGNAEAMTSDQYKMQGPGYPLIHLLPVIPTAVRNSGEEIQPDELRRADVIIAKTMAVISQLLIVAGLIIIGTRHFNNYAMGIGAATLYLMLPYTAMLMGRVTHVLPAALVVWAVVSYRRPLIAGSFLGLAMGLFYYPLFLLPLWVSFYWRRGKIRFAIGFLFMVAILGGVLAIGATGIQDYFARLAAMFGVWSPQTDGLRGIWALGWPSVYRLPILAGFIALSITFAVWPAQKNFGTLLNCSCAIMVAVQFWHGFGGGVYMAWYLPLLLLTIFRPNLEDRVALAVLDESWFKSPRLAKSSKSRSIAA